VKTVFILTDQKHRPWHPDDARLAEAFSKVGIDARPVVWDAWDPPAQASVLIRTPWDYATKSQAFLKLLETINARGGRLWNDYQTLIWNLDKSYMLELASKGVSIVPTRIEKRLKFEEAFLESLTYPCVFKPLVGCAGKDTFLIRDRAHLLATARVLESQDVMIQPYIPEIVSEGESSFMYFGGVFSHAVLKTAAQGEFRVQDDHGGTVEKYEPSREDVQMGLNILTAAGKAFLYARVDFVRHQGELLLMELEAIEPELFFRFSDQSPSLLAEALAARI